MSKDDITNNAERNNPQGQKDDSISTGNYLQRLRIENGLHIDDISKITKISTSNLRAIENCDYANLPADTFTKGLLVIYAKHLGVDNEEIVSQFFQERNQKQSYTRQTKTKNTGRFLAPKIMAEPSHVSSASVAGIILLVIVVLFTTYCFYTSWNPLSSLTNRTDTIQSMMKNIFPAKEIAKPLVTLQPKPSKPASPKSTEPVLEIVKQPSAVIAKKIGKKPKKKPPVETKNQVIEPKSETTDQVVEKKAATSNLVMEKKVEKENPGAQLYTLTAYFLRNTEVQSIADEREPEKQTFRKGNKYEWNAKQSLTLIFSTQDSAELQLNGRLISFPQPENGHLILRVPEVMLDQ